MKLSPIGITLLAVAGLLAAGAVFLRTVWFHRDPKRVTPREPGLVVAPCDGKVVYIRPIEGGRIVSDKQGERIPVTEIHKAGGDPGREGWIIGIFMTPLDVHFNYAPLPGEVTDVVHTQAKTNLPMLDLWEYLRITYLRRAVDLFARRYELVNERNTIVLRTDYGPVAMVEIADKFVNKIRCFVQPGERVAAGQKVSFISRGSQVDLILFRKDVEFLVEVGRQVYGARTPIARFTGGDR